MKPLLVLLLGLAALMSGCNTVNSRITEKASLFNALDPATQQRLKNYTLQIGDTSDMVYIAFGHPDFIRQNTTTEGQTTTWVYTHRWQEYEGSRFAGYDRRAYIDRRDNTRRVYYEPVRVNVYRDYEEEFLRVTFKDDKVTAIEQAKQR